MIAEMTNSSRQSTQKERADYFMNPTTPNKKTALKFSAILFIVLVSGIAVCLLCLAIIFLPFRGIVGKTNYENAKTICIKIFENQKEEFVSAKNAICLKESVENISIKKVESINFRKNETFKEITFNMDAQGMLGGQYWGIYYTSDDSPAWLFDAIEFRSRLFEGPGEGSYYYQDGNNFYATARIEKHWYFYYMDFDGNKHGLDW